MQNAKGEMALQVLEKLSKAHDKFRKVQSKQMYGEKLTAPQFGVLEILQKNRTYTVKKD